MTLMVRDAGGLYVGPNAQFIPDGTIDVPARAYSTLISSNVGWIQSVIGPSVVPEPAAALLFVGAFPQLLRRRLRAASRCSAG